MSLDKSLAQSTRGEPLPAIDSNRLGTIAEKDDGIEEGLSDDDLALMKKESIRGFKESKVEEAKTP